MGFGFGFGYGFRVEAGGRRVWVGDGSIFGIGAMKGGG